MGTPFSKLISPGKGVVDYANILLTSAVTLDNTKRYFNIKMDFR